MAEGLPGYQLPPPSRPTGRPAGSSKRKAPGKKKRSHKVPAQQAPAVAVPKAGKLSGAQFEQARKARKAAEQARHAARLAASGQISLTVEHCKNPERAHLYQIERLLYRQFVIETDDRIPNEEKGRLVMGFAQAMAKLRLEAELEKRIEELEHERAVEAQVLVSERQTLEIERKRVEAERREIDEEWAKLRTEQARSANPTVQGGLNL